MYDSTKSGYLELFITSGQRLLAKTAASAVVGGEEGMTSHGVYPCREIYMLHTIGVHLLFILWAFLR